jgi:Mg2+ and Co2+ transporter CorA
MSNIQQLEDKMVEVDKRLALVEQKLEIITNNHLAHLQNDVNDIKKYFGWAVGVVFIQLLTVIAFLAFK